MTSPAFTNWARTPEGTRIYAIGDLHGRCDLLDAMHGLIRSDLATAEHSRTVVVYLGDYVDRGPECRALVDRLLGAPLGPVETVFLKGNHEDFMLGFLETGVKGDAWLFNGGDATLASYGVEPPVMPTGGALSLARHEFAAHLPADHRAFFDGLRLTYSEGDYLFVHAGVRPGVPVEAQDPRDLMWIREQFLESDEEFGVCVVHGHTIAPAVQVKRNRIGIDTGAYRSGRLSCAVLEGDSVRFLQT